MSKEIFISYSRKDIDKVKTIKSQIEMLTGADCWMDLEGIESGSPQFDEVIVRGINDCHVFLFMLSKNSQESEFALNELELAIRKFRAAKDKRKVVLVNIDGCEMTDVFYLRYSRVDIIDWKDNPQQTKLIRDLCKWVGKKGKNFQEPENIDDDISRVQPVTSSNKKIRNIFKTIRLSWNNYPVRNKRNGCLIAVSIALMLIVIFVPLGLKEDSDFVLNSSDTKNSNVQEEMDTNAQATAEVKVVTESQTEAEMKSEEKAESEVEKAKKREEILSLVNDKELQKFRAIKGKEKVLDVDEINAIEAVLDMNKYKDLKGTRRMKLKNLNLETKKYKNFEEIIEMRRQIQGIIIER